MREPYRKPEFTWKTCAQCMACIQWCPAGAIHCGKKTETRKRYHHPDIQVKELLQKADAGRKR